MAVNRQPVLKRCRNLGLEPSVLGIYKKSKKQVQRTNKKISEYGSQLREKQKAKFIYGVLETQFRNYFKKASNMNGVVGENLLRLLELRLDNVMFRAGFARTRMEARQIVGHKMILVNGKKANVPSYQLKPGDVIEVKEKCRTMQRFKDITEATGRIIYPSWMTVEPEAMRTTINALPNREQIDIPVNETLIVELYSK